MPIADHFVIRVTHGLNPWRQVVLRGGRVPIRRGVTALMKPAKSKDLSLGILAQPEKTSFNTLPTPNSNHPDVTANCGTG
jgi:hypothetical protein